QTVYHTMNFTPGVWTNFIYSSDGDSLRYYKNGVKLGTIPKNTSGLNLSNQDGDLTFGLAGEWNQFRYLDGKLDDIIIYDRALTQTEIDSISLVNQLLCNPVTGTETRTECDSYTWIDGNTYTANNNTATFNITGGAANSCDSIVTLDLTITPDTSYTNITACDSVVWNGTTYNSSGSYTGSSISNNYSANLDGINDYVDVGNNSVLDVDNSVTIEAWINPANLSNRYGIYSTRKNNDPGSFQLEIGSDVIGTNYVAVTGVNTYVAITGSNVINTNSGWVHIAYTRDGVGNNHEIYINGIPQIINTNPYTFINNNTSKEIGRGINLLQNYDGQIDQVRIWDIALTQLEIQNYMDCSPEVNEVGLVGYWNFEEGSGTTVFDLTSNANNGTLNGATYDTDAPSQLCPFTNTAGCDSVAVLNLTIVAITGTDTQLACNSYTWIDGNTYTTNNNTATFNIIGGAAGGCDSLVTLNLTIVNSTIPALNLGNDTTICNGSVLVLDAGLTYDTYNWSTSDTTQTIAVNSAGTYFVEVASNTNASTGPNLITNSDFSSNGAFWNACGNTIEAYAPETTYGGSNATNTVAEIDAGPDNTIGTADDMSLCQTVVGLTIGQSYQLCFNYSRRDIGPNPTTTFITIDGGSLNQTLIASNSTFAFTQACYTFTATQTTHLLSFTPGNSGQEGMILDDISTHILTSLSCYTSDTIQVFVETPVQTVSFSNPICFGDNNGNIYVDNALAFEYSSDSGTNWQIDSFFVNLTSGNYSICSRTALGCTVCDIVILNSLPQISGTDTRTECNSYTWIDGNTFTASNNSATFNITNGAANGCDSLVTLNLTIVNATSGTDTRTECNSYTWFDGINYTASNNSATFNIVGGAANGCDSLVTLDLTINNVSDLTTSSSGAIITANNLSASCQWLDCDNSNVTITGETGQSYTAVANGNYAVELTENGCVDTSACVAITSVGIIENDFGDVLSVYPNPTNGNFSIDLGSIYESSAVKIVDISGKLIDSKIINQSRILNLTIEAPSSIYIISIQAGGKKAVIRLVKE
ncbi:MAG: T9SS type A sorting domain-containing protein, partial [Crocinitomicaceae bacterium]